MQINSKIIPYSKSDDTKQIQENLNKWDDLCQLNDEQILSITKLQQFNQYQFDDDFGFDNNLDVNNENEDKIVNFYKTDGYSTDLNNLDRVIKKCKKNNN
jgi:hypothetical protein